MCWRRLILYAHKGRFTGDSNTGDHKGLCWRMRELRTCAALKATATRATVRGRGQAPPLLYTGLASRFTRV